ncbi:unnamed protein product [Brachionus calyciflorus]|uniref:Mitochondrial fission 1 protein n=1 Tax=Brachionus calyciflorus TaxID=104777 RepID=A0A813TM67_9BILA|nr:unnamed protein product [Brachionus calyciflorus]
MLEEYISDADLKKARENYGTTENPNETQQFEFALNLIRSKHRAEIEEGLYLFQNVFARTKDENIKRDTLYYMAIGQTKLSNYEQALKFLQSILNVQPTNEQVRDLYVEVNKKMKRDGLIGLGIVGSAAAVGLVGIIGLGAALLSKK